MKKHLSIHSNLENDLITAEADSDRWVKGETSGHYQYVKALSADCDNDTLLAKVEQIGAACHTGNHTCFYRQIVGNEYDSKNSASGF